MPETRQPLQEMMCCVFGKRKKMRWSSECPRVVSHAFQEVGSLVRPEGVNTYTWSSRGGLFGERRGRNLSPRFFWLYSPLGLHFLSIWRRSG